MCKCVLISVQMKLAFARALDPTLKEPSDGSVFVADQIEAEMFTAANESTSNAYRSSVRSHLFNLRVIFCRSIFSALLTG